MKTPTYEESLSIMHGRMIAVKRMADTDDIDPRAFAACVLAVAVVTFHGFGVPLTAFHALVDEMWANHDARVAARAD